MLGAALLPPLPHPRNRGALLALQKLCQPALHSQDTFFSPLRGSLVKLVMLSSAIHQAVFAAGSSMPFAVGQVQVSLSEACLLSLAAPALDSLASHMSEDETLCQYF